MGFWRAGADSYLELLPLPLDPLDENRRERLRPLECIGLGPHRRVLHLDHTHDLDVAVIGRERDAITHPRQRLKIENAARLRALLAADQLEDPGGNHRRARAASILRNRGRDSLQAADDLVELIKALIRDTEGARVAIT